MSARRSWSVMIARSTASRLLVRLIDARPMSTAGVPPMRSRVQNENPLRGLPSRARLTSTHASAALERKPTS